MKLLLALVALAALSRSCGRGAATDTSRLRDDVRVDKILKHLQRLQAIADANGGTRASGMPGYDASAQYVSALLADQGYAVTVQPFDFAFFRELTTPAFARLSPSPRAFVANSEFFTMTYSGSGDTTAELRLVDTDATPPPPPPSPPNTSGCQTADFAGFPAGGIAMMQRGSCAFGRRRRTRRRPGRRPP